MPELPEIEALSAVLVERAVGHFVERAEPLSINVLKTFNPPPSALAGLEVEGVTRHGKFLDLTIGGLHLITHLSRAGWLRWKPEQPAAPARPGKSPLAFRLVLDDASGFDLTEQGTQKRLAVYIVGDPAEVPGIARLGIDPFSAEFTTAKLQELLTAGGRSQVKGVLTDQTKIAGVGNAYSDEVLWAARLSPFKPAASLGPDQVALLHAAIVSSLQEAVDRSRGLAAGTIKSDKKAGLAVHARAGLPCPRCGDIIREVSFADKSLQYCPTCQTGGKPLADRRLSRLLK